MTAPLEPVTGLSALSFVILLFTLWLSNLANARCDNEIVGWLLQHLMDGDAVGYANA
jgi:hypothetical protein